MQVECACCICMFTVPIVLFFTAVQSYIIPTYSIIYPAWSVPGLAQWCIPIFIIDDHVVGDTEHIIIQLTSDDSIVQIDENVQTTDVVILEDDQDCMLQTDTFLS